jgi:hypothetical protein
MIFSCDYTYTYRFVIFKKVKSVLKMIFKKSPTATWHGGRGLLPWRWAAGSWCRAARPCRQECSPAAVPHGGRDLTPWSMEAGMLPPCHRAVGTRNFWFDHLFFENQKKYKKS